MKLRKINIDWSEEDKAYVAAAPDLPGCMADGRTPQRAVSNLITAAVEWRRVSARRRRASVRRLRARGLIV